MENRNIKRKINFKSSLKNFKTNFCGLIGKDHNYDYAQYIENKNDNSSTERALDIIGEVLPKNRIDQSIDDLERIVSPRIKATQSRSRLPIYYTNNQSMMNSETLHEEIYGSNDYQPPWHSTKIDVDQTYIQSIQNGTRTIDLLREAIKPQNSFNSDHDSSKSSFDSTTSPTNTDDMIFYACIYDYDAVNDGDLTVCRSDLINILNDDTSSEFVLVEHVRSQKCGYIPRTCVKNVYKFLADLKH